MAADFFSFSSSSSLLSGGKRENAKSWPGTKQYFSLCFCFCSTAPLPKLMGANGGQQCARARARDKTNSRANLNLLHWRKLAFVFRYFQTLPLVIRTFFIVLSLCTFVLLKMLHDWRAFKFCLQRAQVNEPLIHTHKRATTTTNRRTESQ